MGNLNAISLSSLVMNGACEQEITTSHFSMEVTRVHIESEPMVQRDLFIETLKIYNFRYHGKQR